MYHEVTSCRCCGSSDLVEYLNLGDQPLASRYHTGERLESYPLRANFCRACSHSQLSVAVDRDLIFKNYLNLSGTSGSFKTHCCQLAAETARLFEQDEKVRVLDIGCNDGTLLECYREIGCETYGIDPALNMALICQEKGIEVVPHYFSFEWASNQTMRYELITATNVFAHVDSLSGFFAGCYKLLYDTGRLVMEIPYAENMVRNNEFDTIHHEHLNYFTVTSFAKLAERCRFCIESAEKTSQQGGSLLFMLRKDFGQGNCKQVGELLAKERLGGVLNEEMYHSFADRVRHNREVFLGLIGDLQAQGKWVIGYGACTKASTMLNYFGLKLDCIVDDNRLKWGRKMPGSDTPILDPEVLKSTDKPAYVIVAAWNCYREIVGRVQLLRPTQSDTFIAHVPEVMMEM